MEAHDVAKKKKKKERNVGYLEGQKKNLVNIFVVQWLSRVQVFAAPWT